MHDRADAFLSVARARRGAPVVGVHSVCGTNGKGTRIIHTFTRRHAGRIRRAPLHPRAPGPARATAHGRRITPHTMYICKMRGERLFCPEAATGTGGFLLPRYGRQYSTLLFLCQAGVCGGFWRARLRRAASVGAGSVLVPTRARVPRALVCAYARPALTRDLSPRPPPLSGEGETTCGWGGRDGHGASARGSTESRPPGRGAFCRTRGKDFHPCAPRRARTTMVSYPGERIAPASPAGATG